MLPQVRTMTDAEVGAAATRWHLSKEKKELDRKQEALKLQISWKAGSYSPRDHTTGALW